MANITYIRIDDEVYALHDDNALTSDSSLDASKVVGTLPANTYTNTTYESKAAVQGGTDVSLVTTGDKYRWNNASGSGVSDVEVNGSSVVSGGVAEITVPTKTSDLTNDSNFQNATQVDTAINSRIASVYKAKGSVAFLNLPALTSSNEGFVYDINESFTTTSDFVEGSGKTYPAGTNVVIIDIGSGVYKYDVLTGLVDLSGKQDLLVSGTNIKTIDNQSILGSGDISISFGLQNLVDGSSIGSVRGISTEIESSFYIMGANAFAEGDNTKASGNSSHAEGGSTIADGNYSHAEGLFATASGYCSHAQNESTIAAKKAQTVLGTYNIGDTSTTTTHPSKSISYGQYAVIVGNGTSNQRSNALTVDWQGNVDIPSGSSYKINGTALSASDVGAQPTLVSGTNIKTINNQSVLGSGNLTISGGLQNLVDGSSTGSVRGINTAAENSSYTIGENAFAEGYYTQASGNCSHAEGFNTEAGGSCSHAEGVDTHAMGDASHSIGSGTSALSDNQVALGMYNVPDEEILYAVIVGNGENSFNRSNALTVDWNGNVSASGDVIDGNGNVLSEKADTTDLADYVLKATPYFELDTTATSGTDKEIYDALVALGWDSDVIV